MPQKWRPVGLSVLIAGLLVAYTVPTVVEFFGCHGREGEALSSTTIVIYLDGRRYTRCGYADENPARAHHRYSLVRY